MFKDALLSWQLQDHVGEKATVRWRLHTVRLVWSGLAFLILRDRDGFTQIVIEDKDEIEKLNGCLLGTILTATWTVAKMPKWKFPFEIQKWTLNIIRKIIYPSPIDISKDTISADGETIHDNKVVVLRHPRYMKIFKIAGIVERNIRKWFDENDFTQINTPKIIWFPTEGWSEVFEVNYFDKKVYLAQSPQFYKQIMVPVFEKVYEIGRAYRAEKSNTNRHMSEILMLDMEMWFIDSFEDIIQTTEKFVIYSINETWKEWEKILTDLNASKPLMPEKFPRISVKDLHILMKKETWEDFIKLLDLSSAEEKFICEYSAKNWWSDFVLVTEFPWADAKFYHHQNSENPEVTDRADLLFRGVEIITLTQREVNYDRIVAQIKAQWLDPDHPWLKYYLDAFKYGMPDEGGFGFGMARFIQKIIWLENAKEAELFPRDMNRVTP